MDKPAYKNLQEKIDSLSEKRKEVVSLLLTRDWFKNTDFKIQLELLSLPEDFDPYLEDMGDRKEEIGQVKVLKLDKIQYGNYLVISVFEVQSLLTNEKYSYEYVSWKFGRRGGYRGLILIETEGEIKYFMVKKAHKFPISGEIYDAIGSFDLGYAKDKLIHLPSQIEKKIKEFLEVKDLDIRRHIDLGLFNPDSGMTNNRVVLFALVITADESKNLEKNLGPRSLGGQSPNFQLEVHPVEKLFEFITKSDDSYFLACIARLLALGVIKI